MKIIVKSVLPRSLAQKIARQWLAARKLDAPPQFDGPGNRAKDCDEHGGY
jgi:hypothetical protein